MAETPSSERELWLAAAWPGMGNVGVAAGMYLLNKLGARLVHELPAREVFDLQHIEVREGLARAGRVPRSMFFEWTNPDAERDLLVFLGEAQPPAQGYSFCHRLLDYAARRNVSQVVTFAAMATQLHPSNQPNVFGVATNGERIRALQALEVNLLKEGQVTGLNGVLLAAAAERNLPGVCLLGELPYFAAGVPNPKASLAVLEVFTTMFGIEIDFADLREQAKVVEGGLLKLLDKLKEAAAEQGETPEGFAMPSAPGVGPEAMEDESDESEDEANPGEQQRAPLDYEARRRIEALFEAASRDRGRAVHLKQELDRLGVFKQYEDRFLDLFKKAE